jgi:hypothetical protein
MTARAKKSVAKEGAGTSDVDAFLAALKHPSRDEILALREAILRLNPSLTEHIKWKAPSFCADGDDRVTFRFSPKSDAVQLIFHRGAKVKDTKGFRFNDTSGLLCWAAVDRGVVTFATAEAITRDRETIAKLVGAWVAATAP